MDLKTQLGYYQEAPLNAKPAPSVVQYINLKLAALGRPIYAGNGQSELNEIAAPLLANHREKNRLLADYPCAADKRIRNFLTRYLELGSAAPRTLPHESFTLDRHGLARALSLPADGDSFSSSIIKSYRLKQGILHNPDKDRRTTQGVFHIADGGLPVPADKKEVPKHVFGALLQQAINPPKELLRLPFTSSQEDEAYTFVSLLLRPLACPEVPGISAAKSTEVRFFAPGSLVSNLDFVESIFGNAGDPFLPENDSALDPEHWTGHTGCVILAPHLTKMVKKDLGLPHWDDATERQRRDGMCWRDENELYNNGTAYKITCRDEEGVIVTLIADNYFGYCKKEVKTQISYVCNLMGGAEEEHAGGALAFPSYDLGEDFLMHSRMHRYSHSFDELVEQFGDLMHVEPKGYGVDKLFPDILYVPETARFNMHDLTVSWDKGQGPQSIRLLPSKTYVRPSGYKVQMKKMPGQKDWRLIGTVAEGTFCHKPCTVSGGGKSEISKPITDAILHGPVVTANVSSDFDQVEAILNKSYDDRFREGFTENSPSRTILDANRSLGSVIKLLTPSTVEYNDAYNAWLKQIPNYIKELVFVVKRYYRPEWEPTWRKHFSVDFINGQPGHELKCDGRGIIANYLRMGYEKDGSWRVFGLRSDFIPSAKLQMEDDISASTVLPSERLQFLNPDYKNPCVKLIRNCEYRLFQRPDEAVHPGHDEQTEKDFTQPRNFLSNYAPLRAEDARGVLEDAVAFDRFTPPMKELIQSAATMTEPEFFACPAFPRVIDGAVSVNPRYLQDRPDLVDPQSTYLAELGTRLFRRVPLDQAVHFPVNAVLPGRRNNPPDTGIRSLAVFNPIHYLELPELFIEFIASMTGKSPSTTGAGSEGALTKGPFNALLPITDLNNALVSYILTGYDGFITGGGYLGPNFRFDHDISLIIPEIWCRMSVEERDPRQLIERGMLEPVHDFEHDNKPVLASRIGHRITSRFVNSFFGRIFTNPAVIFTDEMLRPEKQDLASFVDGIDNIVTTGQRVAQLYFEDGSVELACPPIRALLHVMAYGQWEGRNAQDPELRNLFNRETMLASDWYQNRLARKQTSDAAQGKRKIAALEAFLAETDRAEFSAKFKMNDRLEKARAALREIEHPDYTKSLVGTIGLDKLRVN